MFKKILFPFLCVGCVGLVSSTAKTTPTQEQSNLQFSSQFNQRLEPMDSHKDSFDETLHSWLTYMGFKGDVLGYQKEYNSIGYLDYFRITLQDAPSNRVATDRKPAKLLFELSNNEDYEFADIKVIGKDISNLPYMYFDWIARYAISYAVKKISAELGVVAKTENMGGGIYRVTIDPAPTTEPSRYRFTQIEVYYEVENLFLNADIKIKGIKDYLMLSFLKSEVHGILRALENGHFPGTIPETLTAGLLRGSTDYLVRDFLKIDEAGHETLLKLEHNPQLKVEELEP